MSTENGVAFCMSPCLGCGRIFCYHPDRVPSITVKAGTGPGTGRPPAYDPAGRREPVCPACCKAANPERAARGLELLDERDTMDLLADDAWGVVPL